MERKGKGNGKIKGQRYLEEIHLSAEKWILSFQEIGNQLTPLKRVPSPSKGGATACNYSRT